MTLPGVGRTLSERQLVLSRTLEVEGGRLNLEDAVENGFRQDNQARQRESTQGEWGTHWAPKYSSPCGTTLIPRVN